MDMVRIALATGNEETNKIIEAILTQEGYNVIGSYISGGEALRLVRTQRPDLIIVSFNLPDMTGFDLSSIICGDSICPVIIVCNPVERSTCMELVRQMNIVVIERPMTKVQILNTIDIQLQQSKRMKDLETTISKLNETLEARKIIDRAKGMLLSKYPTLCEEDVYGALRTESMNQRLSMKKIAELVIEEKIEIIIE